MRSLFAFFPAILAMAQSASALSHGDKTLDVYPRQGGNPDNIMMFTCDKVPEVCTNMCYGAFCLDVGESLNHDTKDESTQNDRRKVAGCLPKPNRCSTKKDHDPGYQCDEYPFASTVSDGGSSKRVNRCVPKKQNSSQGGTITAFYNSDYCHSDTPCKFTVGFENPGNIKYCDAAGGGGDCTNDGKESIDSDGNKKRDTKSNAARKYRLASGGEVIVPGGALKDQMALRVVSINETLWEEQTNSHEPIETDANGHSMQYDYMLENLKIQEDRIVEELDG